jgi:ADP-ribose pyrophosphatase
LFPLHPIVGVGLLIKQDNKYLLIKRAAEPDKGLWSIPGGLVELGELIVEAAKREALEETSLKVKILDRIGVVDKIVIEQDGQLKYHFIIIDFLAKPVSGKLQPRDDALDARWVLIDEFKNFELTPSLIELLNELNLY